jgi:hypothetical protein
MHIGLREGSGAAALRRLSGMTAVEDESVAFVISCDPWLALAHRPPPPRGAESKDGAPRGRTGDGMFLRTCTWHGCQLKAIGLHPLARFVHCSSLRRVDDRAASRELGAPRARALGPSMRSSTEPETA